MNVFASIWLIVFVIDSQFVKWGTGMAEQPFGPSNPDRQGLLPPARRRCGNR